MSIFSYLRRHTVVSIVGILVVIILAIIGGRAASQKDPVSNNSGTKHVVLVNASKFRQGNLSVSANGVVESHSQADLKSQTSAPVSLVRVSIGDPVYPGQTILELENADLRAQLAQAEASLELAKGQFSTGEISVNSAKRNVIDKLRDAYIKTYDGAISQAESILYNNNGSGGRLTSYSVDTTLNSEISSLNLDLRSGLQDWKTSNDSLTSESSFEKISETVKLAEKNIQNASSLLADMNRLMNKLAPYATADFLTSINAWTATISAAQVSISSASQALNTAKTSMDTARSTQGSTAQAQISVAQAGVDNLRAQLAKTIIRSPIGGKVSTLPLRQGELASPGTLLATVIGDDLGLRIKSYVSGEDLSRVKIGSPVNVLGSSKAKGTVSNIAPGVDSVTRKAEVDIDLDDSEQSGLVIGQNVSVSISPLAGTSVSGTDPKKPDTYLLPIQDVKIIPGSAYVFTVDSESKIKRNDVILGQIRGDFVEVVSGLSDEMDIVTPVYELDEGEIVKTEITNE